MKGIVLAGGTGSRMRPLTLATGKHLLPVGTKPMIFHPLLKLKEVNVTEIMMVIGREHMGDVLRLLGSGADLGVDLTYRVQDRAGGIAEALAMAEDFVGDDSCIVLLADNIFEESLHSMLTKWKEYPHGALLALKEVHDPKRYGVAELRGERVLRIVEKPIDPRSNLAVIGVYIYDRMVFDFIRKLEPSARGELEITDVNNHYVVNDLCKHVTFDGWWTDAGTFASWRMANELVFQQEGVPK